MVPNILVVDDANEFADLIVLDLKSRNYNARAQYSGLSAITSAFSLQYNFILLDIMMPGDITLKELLQIQKLDYNKTLIPITDDVFFSEEQSRIPINDIFESNILGVQDLLLRDNNNNFKKFQPLFIMEKVQIRLCNMGDIFIHLDGYVTSCIIKSTLRDLNAPYILFFTAGGVDDAYYNEFNGFFADGLYLKSNYYDKVLSELASFKNKKNNTKISEI